MLIQFNFDINLQKMYKRLIFNIIFIITKYITFYLFVYNFFTIVKVYFISIFNLSTNNNLKTYKIHLTIPLPLFEKIKQPEAIFKIRISDNI